MIRGGAFGGDMFHFPISGGAFMEGGIKSPLILNHVSELSLGLQFIGNPSRQITTCSDCKIDEIPLGGGSYIQYRFILNLSRSEKFNNFSGIYFSLAKYLGGDQANNGFSIGYIRQSPINK